MKNTRAEQITVLNNNCTTRIHLFRFSQSFIGQPIPIGLNHISYSLLRLKFHPLVGIKRMKSCVYQGINHEASNLEI